MHGYRRINSVSRDLSGVGTLNAPALVPVSDKSAIANAVKLFARGQQMHGLSAAQQAQGAVSGAAAGAKAGSIVPGVGTVIGAVVGAVVGWLATKSKPVRPTAQQLADCRTLTGEYMTYAGQYPTTPLPLELPQIRELVWCSDALYGSMVKLRDPRFFAGGFAELAEMCKQIVRKVYETPVGATVDIGTLNFRDAKGRNISAPGMSFVNKPFISIMELTERVWLPLRAAQCGPWGGAACTSFFNVPLVKRVYYDMLGYAARMELPNISEADLRAASQVAATIPNTSASTVVKAVEQIIQRNVQRGETATVLAPIVPPTAAPAPSVTTPSVTTPAPPASAPPAGAPPVNSGVMTPVIMDDVFRNIPVNTAKLPAPQASEPTITPAQLPGGAQPLVQPETAGVVTQLIESLRAQGASSNQMYAAAMQSLASQGVQTTPALQQSVAAQVQREDKTSFYLLGGGLLLLTGFFFMRRAR